MRRRMYNNNKFNDDEKGNLTFFYHEWIFWLMHEMCLTWNGLNQMAQSSSIVCFYYPRKMLKNAFKNTHGLEKNFIVRKNYAFLCWDMNCVCFKGEQK